MKIENVAVLKKVDLVQFVKETYNNVGVLNALSEEYGYMDEGRWLRFYKFKKELQVLIKEIEMSQK